MYADEFLLRFSWFSRMDNRIKKTYLVLIEHKIFSKNVRMAETLEHCVHETAKQRILSDDICWMWDAENWCLPCVPMIFESSDTGHLIRWPYVAAERWYSPIQCCRLLCLCEWNGTNALIYHPLFNSMKANARKFRFRWCVCAAASHFEFAEYSFWERMLFMCHWTIQLKLSRVMQCSHVHRTVIG